MPFVSNQSSSSSSSSSSAVRPAPIDAVVDEVVQEVGSSVSAAVGRTIVLHGPPKTGKSYCARELFHRLQQEDYDVVLVTCTAVPGPEETPEQFVAAAAERISSSVAPALENMPADSRGLVLIIDNLPLCGDDTNYIGEKLDMFGPSVRQLIVTTVLPRPPTSLLCRNFFGARIGSSIQSFSVIPTNCDLETISNMATPYTGTIITNFIALGRCPGLMVTFDVATYTNKFVGEFERLVKFFETGTLLAMPSIGVFISHFLGQFGGKTSKSSMFKAAYIIYAVEVNRDRCWNCAFAGIILRWYISQRAFADANESVVAEAARILTTVLTSTSKHHTGAELEALTEVRILMGITGAQVTGSRMKLHKALGYSPLVSYCSFYRLDQDTSNPEVAKTAIETRMQRYPVGTAMLVCTVESRFKCYDHFLVFKAWNGNKIFGIQEKTTKAKPRKVPPLWMAGSIWIQGNNSVAESYKDDLGWLVLSQEDVENFYGPSLSLMLAAHWSCSCQ
jgi:hypothetical protein